MTEEHARLSADTAGVYGAEKLPPGVSIASANKAIEFLEWLSGYIGHGPAVQINSDQMEYIRSKVHPLVHELDGRSLAQPQAAPVLDFFSQNVDAWGAAEWFDRLAKAVREQDAAVVAGDMMTMETCRNVASSSAMRLVRDYEPLVRAALAVSRPKSE